MKIEITFAESANSGFDCECLDEGGGGEVRGGSIDDVRNLVYLIVEENLIHLADHE